MLTGEDSKVSSAKKLLSDIPLTGLSGNGEAQASNACIHLQTTPEKKFKSVARQKMLIKEIRILKFITIFRKYTLQQLIFQATLAGDFYRLPLAVLVRLLWFSYQYSLKQQKQPHKTKIHTKSNK